MNCACIKRFTRKTADKPPFFAFFHHILNRIKPCGIFIKKLLNNRRSFLINDDSGLPFGDGDDDTEDYDEEEAEDDADDDIGEDDNNNADTVTSTSEAQKQSLGDKTVKFFQANNIKDKNYVIWVVGNEVYKSIDMALLKRLDDFDFIKLK